MSEKYTFKIDADTRDAIKNLGDVAKAAQNVGREQADAAKQSGQAWSVFKGVVSAQAFVGAFKALTGAAKGLFNTFVSDGITAANATEQATNKLTSALKASGEMSDATMKDFAAFADQMQATTIYGDDATTTVLALAKTMGLSNEEAKQAVIVSADLAATTGGTLESAFKKIQATYNGSAGKLGQMSEGVRNLTKEQLENGAVLKVLGAELEGRAAAQLNTYSGQIDKTKNSFTEIQKVIGFAITQNPAVVSAFQSLNEVFADLKVFLDENISGFRDLVAFGFETAIAALKITIESIKTLAKFVSDNIELIKAFAVGLATAATVIGAYTIAVNASAIATAAITVATKAWSLALAATPIGLIVTGLTALGAGIYLTYKNWDELTATIKIWTADIINQVLPAISYVLGHLSTLVGIFDKDLSNSIKKSITDLQDYSDSLKYSGKETLEQIKITKASAEAAKEAAKDKAKAGEEEVAAAQNVLKQKEIITKDELKAQEKFQAEIDKLNLDRQIKEEELRLQQLTDEELHQETRLMALMESLGREEAIKFEAQRRILEAQEQTVETIRTLALLEEQIKTATVNKQIEEQKRLNDGLISLDQERANKLEEQRKAEAEKLKKERDGDLAYFMNTEDRKTEWAAMSQRRRLDTVRDSFRSLESLQRSSNKKQAELGKNAAVVGATVDTYKAATGAYASLAGIPVVGPALGIAAAAAAIAAGLQNVNQIKAQRYERGGIVGGSSYSGDKVMARVNSGELILNRAQQNNLAGQMTGGDNSAVVEGLRKVEDAVRSIQIRIGDSDVFEAVRRETRSGRRLA